MRDALHNARKVVAVGLGVLLFVWGLMDDLEDENTRANPMGQPRDRPVAYKSEFQPRQTGNSSREELDLISSSASDIPGHEPDSSTANIPLMKKILKPTGAEPRKKIPERIRTH